MTRSLGQVIAARRREMSLTQEQFAELLGEGVRQSEISRLERGLVTMPRPERLQRIADVIDVPVGELLLLTAWAGPVAEAADAPSGDNQPESSTAPEAHTPAERSPELEDVLDRARATMEETRRILDSLDRRQGAPAGGGGDA